MRLMGIFGYGEKIHAQTDKTTQEIILVIKFILFARIIFKRWKKLFNTDENLWLFHIC